MPDPIKLITKRITTMTYQAIDRKAQFIWGNVLSRNPDGTLNVDDGRGGCVLIVPPANARTGDRISVDLGAMIEGVGMPSVATYIADVPQKNHARPPVFIDDAGNTYNGTNGSPVGSGGTPTADIDPAFGYSSSGDLCFAGVSSSYNDLQIGDLGGSGTGYVGEVYGDSVTVLCRGTGDSSGLLMGIEQEAATQYTGPPFPWTVVLRNVSTFALIETNAASYISDWMLDHPTNYLDVGYDVEHSIHVSADPADSSFWLFVSPGTADDPVAPMFNVDPTDGSLVKTVTLDISGHLSIVRVHRVQP